MGKEKEEGIIKDTLSCPVTLSSKPLGLGWVWYCAYFSQSLTSWPQVSSFQPTTCAVGLVSLLNEGSQSSLCAFSSDIHCNWSFLSKH